MSGFFVVEPDSRRDHQHSGSRCTMDRTSMVLEEDLQKNTQRDSPGQAKPGGSNPTMRPAPSTPPRAGSPGRAHQFVSPSGSTVTSNTSPGSSNGGPSPISTAPTSAATSPVARSSEFKPVPRQASGSEHSSGTTQATSVPRVVFDFTSTLGPEIHKDSPDKVFDLDSITLRSLLPTRDAYVPYTRRSAVPSSFSALPPLDLQAPTTFGPYKSPHTLSELHERAWCRRQKPFPIEPCLQCRVKKLPCPLTFRSPCNTHLGPLLNPNDADDDARAPRPSTAHPRFPACLRCIRAGEADCCIVQRRATLEEKAALRPLAKTFSEEFLLDTAIVVLPTDRDVANPAVFAEKMRRRDELLREVEMKEERVALAPRQMIVHRRNLHSEEELKIREGQMKDRLLLSGRGREVVLKPTESWGEKWVGRREAEELEFLRKTAEKADEIISAVNAGGVWA